MNRATENDSWVRNPDGTPGFTSSHITGCLTRCSWCFAMKLANGRLRARYLANRNISTEHLPNGMCLKRHPLDDPFYPRCWPERLEEIRRRKKPAGIFLDIMGEWAGDWVPRAWQDAMFECIRACPQHRFYLLTKQPQNLIKFSPFPDNCWVGVTITEAYPGNTPLAYLEKVEAKVKYISFEPLLKWGTDLTSVLKLSFEKAGINWVIIGAQTHPFKPPRVEWVREIIEACDKAGIPVFLKGNLGWPRLSADGSKPFYKQHPSGTMELRQEMPC